MLLTAARRIFPAVIRAVSTPRQLLTYILGIEAMLLVVLMLAAVWNSSWLLATVIIGILATFVGTVGFALLATFRGLLED